MGLLLQDRLRRRMIAIMRLRRGASTGLFILFFCFLFLSGWDGGDSDWNVFLGGGNRRFRAMEAAATKLQKEAKGYLDALRG